ncbi:MAG: type II toxin-antitoxin system PemK/MazF family toxin [Patescibacteria group bacterium]
MPPVHIKDHDGWNTSKKALDAHPMPRRVYIYPGEIWYCCIGHNIGDEEDGKGSDYSRPVVVIKRFGAGIFIGVPLTTKVKAYPSYFGVGTVDGKAAMALLTQLRFFSTKRLVNKIDKLPTPTFLALKKAAKKYIF